MYVLDTDKSEAGFTSYLDLISFKMLLSKWEVNKNPETITLSNMMKLDPKGFLLIF